MFVSEKSFLEINVLFSIIVFLLLLLHEIITLKLDIYKNPFFSWDNVFNDCLMMIC